MALAALLALLTVSFGLSQHVSGIGVTLLSTGLAFFIYRLVFGQPSQPPSVSAFQTLPIPGLANLPVIGPSVFNQYVLVYLAMALVPGWWARTRTPPIPPESASRRGAGRRWSSAEG
jgi:simple sugar transport system permease protein